MSGREPSVERILRDVAPVAADADRRLHLLLVRERPVADVEPVLGGAPLQQERRSDLAVHLLGRGALAQDLDQIVAADPDFDPADFLNGAKSAYEMIVIAFAQGDRPRLKDLLSPLVFDGFNAAITEREKRHEVMNTTFVAIDSAVLVDAHLKEQMIQVTVKFSSKLITVTKDADGKVIEGAADKIVDVTDIWTFERKARSSSPAWHLVATESAYAA